MQAFKRCRPLIALVYCVLLLACGNEAADMAPADAQADGEEQAVSLRLDLANRTLVYPLDPGIAAERAKFVQVAIGELFNPRLLRISFELRYRPDGGADVLLGTFSPFPPDNPGTYIVATRGLLRPGGTIVLSMVLLDDVGPGDELRVAVKAISLREN